MTAMEYVVEALGGTGVFRGADEPTGSAPTRSSPSRNPRPRMGCTPTASNAATLSWPPLNRSGFPVSFDRFNAAKPKGPIFSKEVYRA